MSDTVSRQLFLSIVTKEFGSYRKLLTNDLRRAGVEVKVQEDFGNSGKTTLEKINDYIQGCDAVIHLVGKAIGSIPPKRAVVKLQGSLDMEKLVKELPFLPNLMAEKYPNISYTQWEAYLAIYHGRRVYIYRAQDNAPRDESFVLEPLQQELQQAHFRRICELGCDRDEFANQERLSSLVLGDLQDILPARESDVVVEPTRLRHTAQKLIGREEALKRLDEAWASSSQNVLVLRAWGGVGKTSLVAVWMAEMAAKGWRGARRVFDWSFYSQGTRQGEEADKAVSADLFIAKALEFFGDPDPQQGSPWDRGARLAKLVAETKSLLVLDGLEPLQQPPGPHGPGRIKDEALSVLLKGLAGNNAGLCVVTTREFIPELNNFYDKTASDWPLEHLSDAAGAMLLHALGVNQAGQATISVDDEELRKASRQVQGHALTLQLMGRYLALAHGGDVRKRDVFGFAEADLEFKTNPEDADKLYGHAFKVMGAYETWLAEGGVSGQRQLAILRLLGFFDRPADPGCLAALRADPPIPGLTDALAGISDAQWNIAIKRLEEIGLVTPVPFAPSTVRGYSEKAAQDARSESLGEPEEFPPSAALRGAAMEAHPLLREYFAGQLREERKDAWREGHGRLYEHLKQRVPYWPEGLTGLQPLYQAVSHGCLAGLHQQARDDVYRDRILRGTGSHGNYSTFKLGAIGADLGAVACFFEQPWCRLSRNLSEADDAWLLNEAAFSLRALGRLTEAVEPMRAGLRIFIEQEVWTSAAALAGNLSELELTLGNVAAAVADGEQSVKFADRSGDYFQRMSKRTTHADALHHAGRREAATALFREAEAMQVKRQLGYPRLYGAAGFQSCDLLLSDAERVAWRIALEFGDLSPNSKAMAACDDVADRAAWAMKIAKQNNRLLDIALAYLTLGRAAFYQAVLTQSAFHIPQSAIDLLTAAVDGLRASGQMDDLPRGLLTRAWLRYLDGDAAGADADLDDAWDIAERGSMRLYMADVQLYRARLFRDRDALAYARELITQCGYHRRDEELADAESAVANWP